MSTQSSALGSIAGIVALWSFLQVLDIPQQQERTQAVLFKQCIDETSRLDWSAEKINLMCDCYSREGIKTISYLEWFVDEFTAGLISPAKTRIKSDFEYVAKTCAKMVS